MTEKNKAYYDSGTYPNDSGTYPMAMSGRIEPMDPPYVAEMLSKMPEGKRKAWFREIFKLIKDKKGGR